MFGIDAAKGAFFDRAAVTDQLDPAIRKALSKFGAFVRTRAKSSLKYGKGTATSGKPPIVHRGGMTRTKANKKTGKVTTTAASPLRELLFFSYDASRKSVVIGPTLGGPATGAPEKLEAGDHPFMRPALAAEQAKGVAGFKDLIR